MIIARAGTPVARLVALTPAPKRRFGAYKGMFRIDDSFFDPLPEDMPIAQALIRNLPSC